MKRTKKTYDIPIDAVEETVAADEAAGDERARDERSNTSPADEPAPEKPQERDLVDHLQRLQAEFSNYRRRVERERLETSAWAQGDLAGKLLPVLDDLERAGETLKDEDSAAANGLRMIREKLVGILTEAGLERIEAAGQTFDPDVHEAVMTQPVDAGQAGQVLAEFEPGYFFRGRLVRPARVQVGVEQD
jgi:molecular chaperone GrpE